MYKVLLTGFGQDLCYQEEEKALFAGLAEVVVLNNISRKELLAAVSDVDAILTDTERIDEEVFSAAPKLKIVSEYGVGIDNIDTKSASAHGVFVCNVPHVYTENVAEHAAALILSCSRCILPASESVKKDGAWDSALLEPKMIRGKTLGLIGFGRIGMALLRQMSGFGVKTVVYDPYIPDKAFEGMDIYRAELDKLLEISDIVSIHVPKTPETINLIGYDQFRRMKKGVILINVSRGGIIDEDALLWALDERIVFSAGLDVMRDEPNIGQSALRRHPRVIITPHIGWKSESAARDIEIECAKNVVSFLRDGVPINVCNKDLLNKYKGIGEKNAISHKCSKG